MAYVQCIGIVSKAEYPLLFGICVASIIGDGYSDYLAFLEQWRADLRAKGVTPVDVNIDVIGFKQWLNGRIATPVDLTQYANYLQGQ